MTTTPPSAPLPSPQLQQAELLEQQLQQQQQQQQQQLRFQQNPCISPPSRPLLMLLRHPPIPRRRLTPP